MSDEEVKAPEPVNLDAPVESQEEKKPAAEAVKPEEAKQPEAEKEEAKSPEAEKPDDDGEEEAKKKLSGSERQKRKAQRLAAELAEERSRREILERRLQDSGKPDPNARPGIDREPKEDDFPNDYFAYERSKTAWEVRQAIRSERERDDATRRRAMQMESRLEAVDEYNEGADEARERIPDFDESLKKANQKIPDELADEILSAGKKGPLLAYYLAQHPETLARMAVLTGRELAREVGRLESRVHLPQTKKATEATPPPSQIKGGAAPAFDPFKSDDMNAYVEWRKSGGGKK